MMMVHRTAQAASTVISQDTAGSNAPLHTPTPWFHRQAGEVSRMGEAYDWIADHPGRGQHRKIIVQRGSCNPDDFAFIVKAVNNHEALVGALRFILAFYEPGQRHLDTEAWKCAEAGARAALKNADAT